MSVRRLYAILRKVPLFGSWLHRFTCMILPEGRRIWVKITDIRGESWWFYADARFDESFMQGKHEAPIQSLLGSVLKPGDCFYDVGAHVGFFSMFAARAAK
jgi:hypothetical protein